MFQLEVFRPAGNTYALSVVATSHAGVLISSTVNDVTNVIAVWNTGATTVQIVFSPSTGTATPAVLSVDGTPAPGFTLPPAMPLPIAVACPAYPFQVTAIGSGAGPSIVYLTPVGDPS